MSPAKPVVPTTILLVESNPGDVDRVRETLEGGKVRTELLIVGDGEAALAFLRRTGEYAQAPRPDLVLLDLDLPKKDGREVLAAIKSDPELKRIPVVILTTSHDEEDILRTYNLHANCCVTKPIDPGQFLRVMRTIEEFWLTIVELPPSGVTP